MSKHSMLWSVCVSLIFFSLYCTKTKSFDTEPRTYETEKSPNSTNSSRFGYNPIKEKTSGNAGVANRHVSGTPAQWSGNASVGASSRQAISATMMPQQFSDTLQAGECTTIQTSVHFPASLVPTKNDILMAFDLTNSMVEELDSVKNNATALINSITAILPDVRFGVVSHMDYPNVYESCITDYDYYYDEYANSGFGDYAYQVDRSLTTDYASVISKITSLYLGWGGDNPENYTRILYEAYADTNISWRKDAKKIMIYWHDWMPHSCNFGLNCDIYYPSTNSGADPGRDEIIGTGDDLLLADVLQGIRESSIALISMHSGDYYSLWNCYTEISGGKAYHLNADGSIPNGTHNGIVSLLTSAVYEQAQKISSLSLQVLDPTFASWVNSVIPEFATGIDLSIAHDFSFALTLCVPQNTPDGTYTFPVGAVGDGIVFASQQVSLTITSGKVDVCFDIHPTSCPNPIEIKGGGVIPAAITGTASFDVSRVDPSSVRLLTCAPTRSELEDVVTPYTPFMGKANKNDCTTFGPDGIMDLSLKFDKQSFVAALKTYLGRDPIDKEVLIIPLTGRLLAQFGGTELVGEDVIVINDSVNKK
ncbi:MAG: VWA domain-containing protein [Chitinivibrionales bacterium]|nr:VWA domain-containing protein [Chitinivibrionales bacterium]